MDTVAGAGDGVGSLAREFVAELASRYVPDWWAARAALAGLMPGLDDLRRWYAAGAEDARTPPCPPRHPYHCAAYMDGWNGR